MAYNFFHREEVELFHVEFVFEQSRRHGFKVPIGEASIVGISCTCQDSVPQIVIVKVLHFDSISWKTHVTEWTPAVI